MDNDLMISKMMIGACNLVILLPEGISRFRKRMQEYEAFSKKSDEMKALLVALKQEVEGYAEKEKKLLLRIDELSSQHKNGMTELEKHLEADKVQVRVDRAALEVQKKALLEQKEGLKASLAQATGNNKWLIEHGFQQVVTYLLHSSELNKALSDVYTKLLAHGRHQGFVASYKACEFGEPHEKSSL
ncbi:hypothetical protein HanXRQr2_Chr17g0822291 [Helianthus annuus]|uniref:Uncharacterized protein n=1 Tax=Helianthus annuus TaxID=4232 RepID=A0A9K3DMY6_HELAN|nr:hypothetical protein HanXRQr2_Chr17g0822291 [Helianthus annuus]